MKHKQSFSQQEKMSFTTSNEFHLYWTKYIHKSPLYFRNYADFEAGIQFDKSCKGDKTTNIYKKNPVSNGYYIVSELDDVLKSG